MICVKKSREVVGGSWSIHREESMYYGERESEVVVFRERNSGRSDGALVTPGKYGWVVYAWEDAEKRDDDEYDQKGAFRYIKQREHLQEEETSKSTNESETACDDWEEENTADSEQK